MLSRVYINNDFWNLITKNLKKKNVAQHRIYFIGVEWPVSRVLLLFKFCAPW
jgi:hypothetical protein